ncbi:uncharacterized protein LOC143566478 [Bidens hawaiensis]|uniref:uncharacterized protein LOC143566478 n=1 Tax=Bidens hawaiensis TaxID=980011 RepID=UPI00404ABAA1
MHYITPIPKYFILIKMASFGFLIFLLLILLPLTPILCTNDEGTALLALKTKLSGPENVLQSWDPSLENPCTWYHVTCDYTDHVIRLDLENSNLGGILALELGELGYLQHLELYGNNIEGELPTELGNLENLITMDLFQNKFQGQIPESFANLKSLAILRLNDNKLAGPIPADVANLPNLLLFNVSNNYFNGNDVIPVDGSFTSFPTESVNTTN